MQVPLERLLFFAKFFIFFSAIARPCPLGRFSLRLLYAKIWAILAQNRTKSMKKVVVMKYF
jgi:hypothetical protein